MDTLRLDSAIIQKILERGNDVWIKRTKTGVVILEVGVTKRQEIGGAASGQRQGLKGVGQAQ